MRTTVNLPDDLHHAVASIAAHNRTSLNETVAALIRRGLAQPGGLADAGAPMHIDPATALPTIRSPRAVSAEDVKALDDE